MYVLRAITKPRYAKSNSDYFYYRDRARKDCEGIKGATKFANKEDAEKANMYGAYEVIEISDI